MITVRISTQEWRIIVRSHSNRRDTLFSAIQTSDGWTLSDEGATFATIDGEDRQGPNFDRLVQVLDDGGVNVSDSFALSVRVPTDHPTHADVAKLAAASWTVSLLLG